MSDDPTRALVEQIVALIEAGDDIRCYPSGAVGFDEWHDARDAAQLIIGRWVDEDGTWRDIPTAGTCGCTRGMFVEPPSELRAQDIPVDWPRGCLNCGHEGRHEVRHDPCMAEVGPPT